MALRQSELEPLQAAPDGSHCTPAAMYWTLHARDVPSQRAAASHGPRGDWQTVPLGCAAWAGQLALVPVHARPLPQGAQTVPADLNRSLGQLADAPLQYSATSQVPAVARQSVPAALYTFVGQSAEVPLQLSATSHVPAAARQTVPAATYLLVGHADDVPLQTSATSHGPAAARHTFPDESLSVHVDVPLHMYVPQAGFAGQVTVEPAHTPEVQTSLYVHALPSLQDVPFALFVAVQPPVPSQAEALWHCVGVQV